MTRLTSADQLRDSYPYLVVGAGVTADAAARAVHEADPDAAIAVIGDEPDDPISRPALSKKLWTDPEFDLDDAWLHTADVDHVDLLLDTAVDSVDPGARTVQVGGRSIGYGSLLLATGGRTRTLDLPTDRRVLYYRTWTDYTRLRELIGTVDSVAVVGGSWIGAEIAAAMAGQDVEVTLITPDDLVLEQVLPSRLATHLTDVYTEQMVRLRTGVRVTGGEVADTGITLHLDDGSTVTSEVVVAGLGIEPITDLAAAAGLEVDDGIVVDEHLRTSDPHIWAAGDVANYPDALLGRRRVEHIDQAESSGATAGRNLTGADEVYDHTPIFYSDLFEDGFEAIGDVGHGANRVEVLADDLSTGVVYDLTEDGRVVGVLTWNLFDQLDTARQLIGADSPPPVAELESAIPLDS